MTNKTTTIDIDCSQLRDDAGISFNDRGEGDTNCICCDRGMDEKNAKGWMHLSTYGAYLKIDAPGADDGTHQSQGFFPVGASCVRKVRKALKARGEDPKEWIQKPSK